MFVQRFCMRAAISRPLARCGRSVAALATAVIAMVLAACSQAPRPLGGPDPSDPRSSTRAADYRSVIGPYESQRPVEPAPWREQNDRIAPAPRP
jgi:hypothetical protein